MSLDWNASKVADYETLHSTDEGWAVTQALVFGSIGTGMGTITEENAAEVFARIALIERLHGAFLQSSEGPVNITLDDVKRRVGLSTNVFGTEPRAKFLKRQAGSFLDETVRAAR